jgi:serine/threonine protein phosphatase PrpC/WD40 repeat protein
MMRDYFEWNFDAKSHMGRVRPNNEDYVAFHVPAKDSDRFANGSLFIVADGVGGAEAGEYASQYACEKIIYDYYRLAEAPYRQRLVTAIQLANREIFTYALDHSPDGGMATTVVAALLVKNELYIANVGDSRAYLLTRDGIRQISQDHNIVGEMIAQGVMTEDDARRNHPKNQLTRCVGADLDVNVDWFGPIPLNRGDRILLCTDGLTRYATQGDLVALAGSGKLEDNLIRMVSYAIESGGEDNVSMMLIEAADKATHILKSPIKHVGRTYDFQLRFGASGPSTPTKLPETQPGAKKVASKRKIPWGALAIALLAVVAVGVWLVWAANLATPDTPVSIPLSTSTVDLASQEATLNQVDPTEVQPTFDTGAAYQPGDIHSIALSPDKSLLAVGTDQSGISLVRFNERVAFLNIPTSHVSSVVFISDEALLSTSQDGSLHIWGGENWEEILKQTAHEQGINAVAYSASADLLATASDDKTVAIWSPIKDPGSQTTIGYSELNRMQHNAAVESIAFSPDGRSLLTGAADGTVKEWSLLDYQGKAILSRFTSPVISVIYSVDGKCIAAGSIQGEIRSVCRNQGVVGGENLISAHVNAITGMAFSPVDAGLLASGSADGTIKIWRSFYELTQNLNIGNMVNSLLYTPDGKYLIAGWSNDGINTLTIWPLPFKLERTPTFVPVLTATPTRTPRPTVYVEPPPPPPDPTLIPP